MVDRLATQLALVEAGIDFIKDDELMANPPHSPLEQRVSAIMPIVNAVVRLPYSVGDRHVTFGIESPSRPSTITRA